MYITIYTHIQIQNNAPALTMHTCANYLLYRGGVHTYTNTCILSYIVHYFKVRPKRKVFAAAAAAAAPFLTSVLPFYVSFSICGYV